jgi:hypothetical protein
LASLYTSSFSSEFEESDDATELESELLELEDFSSFELILIILPSEPFLKTITSSLDSEDSDSDELSELSDSDALSVSCFLAYLLCSSNSATLIVPPALCLTSLAPLDFSFK